MRPSVPGYCSSAPKWRLVNCALRWSPSWISSPSGSARWRTTAIVCGWQFWSTKKIVASSLPCRRWHIAIASAAAVPSSSSEQFATCSPLSSVTSVWKFSSASMRPCEISAWYGVYWVYQPGFSRMLRWITAGVSVPW